MLSPKNLFYQMIFHFRDITRTLWSSILTSETIVRISGKNVLNIMASSAVLIPPSPVERNQKSLAEAPRFGNVSVITISRKTHHKPIYFIADTAAGLRNRCRSTSGKTSSRDNHFRGWFPLVLKIFLNLEFPLNFISSSQAANAS